MDRKTLPAWERHGQERDKVIKQALKADVLSQVRTAANYYEDVNYLGNFAGDVLFQHNITKQFINMPLEGQEVWSNLTSLEPFQLSKLKVKKRQQTTTKGKLRMATALLMFLIPVIRTRFR